MPTVTDPRVDAYIERAAPFAQPILRELRERVHRGCPEVKEALKWGMPSFTYRGRIVCSMAAFKQHATFGFWHGDRVVGGSGADAAPTAPPAAGGRADGATAMGQFGRLTALADLPDKRKMAGYVREAMRLIDSGVPARTPRTSIARAALPVPDDLAAALRGSPKAQATFDAFAPSHRREYVEWIVEAKRDDTRQRRIAQAVEWLADGKPRHWKYQKG